MLFQLFPEFILSMFAILYLFTKNKTYSLLLSGSILNIYTGLFLKYLFKLSIPFLGNDFVLRPSDAFACNFFNNVSNKGDVGMPSNHSMLAGYLFYHFFQQKHRHLAWLFLLVPLSRLRNNQFPIINHGDFACHTWFQIIFGFIFGLLFGHLLHFIP